MNHMEGKGLQMCKKNMKKSIHKILSVILIALVIITDINILNIVNILADDNENSSAVDESQVSVWDGKTKIEVTPSENEYLIDSVEELAWFASAVNSGKDFSGSTVVITGDFNLNNKNCSPRKIFPRIFCTCKPG